MVLIRRLLKATYQIVASNKYGRKLLSTSALLVSLVLIPASGLFDASWYRRQRVNLGGKSDALPPLLHYLLIGRKRGYMPNPLFLPSYYDQRKWSYARIDPLLKYVLPYTRGQNPTHPLFDSRNYPQKGLRSPLACFLSDTNPKKQLPTTFGTQLSWQKLWITLDNALLTWQQQESDRSKNQLSKTFDYRKQDDFIDKWSAYELPRTKNGNPLVSIVMPAWNRETVIGEAIESVQNQSLQSWELIIADDGSSDGTLKKIKSYMKHDKRIKVLQLKHGGVCAARNAAITAARGQWIAFLDTDNTWTPQYLRAMVVALHYEKKKAGYGSVELKNGKQSLFRVDEIDTKLLALGNFIDLNVLVVSKDIIDRIGGFKEDLRRMVDYDLVLNIAAITHIVKYPILGVNYTNHDDILRITNTERVTWSSVVKNKNLINWKELAKQKRQSGISIVLSFNNNLPALQRCLNSLFENTDLAQVHEVIVIDNSSQPDVSMGAAALAHLYGSKVNYLRYPESSDPPLGFNRGYSLTTGKRVVFVKQTIDFEPGWLDAMEVIDDNANIVAPVQLHTRRTIYSAGIIYHGQTRQSQHFPVPLLNDHPVEDLSRLGDEYDAISSSDGCIMVEASLFARLEGFDPIYSDELEVIDFTRRAHEAYGESTRVATMSRIVNHRSRIDITGPDYRFFCDRWSGPPANQNDLWGRAGYKIVSLRPSDEGYGEPGSVTPILKRIKKQGLRWAIKSAHPSDASRVEWGDLYFAEALRDALVSLGHEAVVDNRDTHHRASEYLDDVIVSIRGLVRAEPMVGKTNVLWVISHPEVVTADEIRQFDIVYSAGAAWTEFARNVSGRQVETLLQCTDESKFCIPEVSLPSLREKVLFVGNSRGVLRKIVKDAIDAQTDIAVYGAKWAGMIDGKYIKGDHIPNDELATAYGSAAVVLNDHWDDMRRWGFVSNRLFDASAAGAIILSDKVPGIEGLFPHGAVTTYDNSTDFPRMLAVAFSYKDNQALRQKVSSEVRKHHTFTARAKRIIKDVNSFRGHS